MEKLLQPNLERGKKWSILRARHKALGHDKEIEWMDSQIKIVEDEEAYANSLEPVKEEKEITSYEYG